MNLCTVLVLFAKLLRIVTSAEAFAERSASRQRRRGFFHTCSLSVLFASAIATILSISLPLF